MIKKSAIQVFAFAIILLTPLTSYANDGRSSRLALFFLVYGLGFLLTILLLIIIAKRDGKGTYNDFPPKIPPIQKDI